MEQKRILWVVAAIGFFLVIVIGIALALYPPQKKDETKSEQDFYIQKPSATESQEPSEITIDLNNLGNEKAETASSGNDFLTVNGDPSVIDANKKQEESYSAQPLSAPIATTPKQNSNVIDVIRPGEKKKTSSVSDAPKAETKKDDSKKASSNNNASGPAYWIQVGSFGDKVRAQNAREDLENNKLASEIFVTETGDKLLYRVRIGPFGSKAEAEKKLSVVKTMKDYSESFVVKG